MLDSICSSYVLLQMLHTPLQCFVWLYSISYLSFCYLLKSCFVTSLQELSKCVGKCDDCKCKRQRSVPENTSGVEWYSPTSLAQLYAILEKHRQDNVKLISGNTGKGTLSSHTINITCHNILYILLH